MTIAKLMHVTLHATPKLVYVIVKAFPGGLTAHADSSADHFPCRAGGNGLADKLGFPCRKQTDEGTRSAQRCEWIRVRCRRLPYSGH
jgi:hypothetical protein